MEELGQLSRHLAQNLVNLRKQKSLSQGQLATKAGVPRTTLSHMESGQGNPSLHNLTKISEALGVGIEELLTRPRADVSLIKANQVPVRHRSRDLVKVFKLLPDKIKGIEIDKMQFAGEASLGGHPHIQGTKEYLHVLSGKLIVVLSGEKFLLEKGDVLSFLGDQPHSYRNPDQRAAEAVSVVLPIPLWVR